MSADRTVHLLVEGHVQGVGFRAWAQKEATACGLTGFIRNRRTGAVEIVASGTSAAVETMIAACRIGPSHARIDALYIIGDVRDASLGTFDRIEVRATV